MKIKRPKRVSKLNEFDVSVAVTLVTWRMPRKCIVPGCSSAEKPLHRFPRDVERRRWWVDRIAHPQVKLTSLTDESRLCDVSTKF